MFEVPTIEVSMAITRLSLIEWNDARTAALFLNTTPKNLNEELGHNLERKTANRPGTLTARGGGWLYHRHDLERVRAIMDALGCPTRKAIELLHGIRRLGERRMLEELLITLQTTIEREKNENESI